MPNNRRANAGNAAEQYVSNRLEQDGYTIIARNWFARRGEIDIIALDSEVLVFVEVRSRTGDQFGAAEESVTPAKLHRVVAAGLAFIEENAKYADLYWRVDLVAITLGGTGVINRYNHYKNIVFD